MLETNCNIKKITCNRGPDFQPVNLHDEVIFQEEEANDGEEINQDECENCSEDNGTTIPSNTFYHIQQCLFSVYQIEQLGKAQSRGKMSTKEAMWRWYTGNQCEPLKHPSSHVLNSQLHEHTCTRISVGAGRANQEEKIWERILNFKLNYSKIRSHKVYMSLMQIWAMLTNKIRCSSMIKNQDRLKIKKCLYTMDLYLQIIFSC